MKLLFVIEALAGGGKERRLVQVAKGLLKMYPDIHLHILLNAGRAIHYNDILQTDAQIHLLSAKNNVQLFSQYKRKLEEIRPDIVQCWSVKSAVYFSCLKPWFSYRLISAHVADCFGYSGIVSSLYHRLIYRCADLVIGNSKRGLDVYRVPALKARHIYNGVDFSRLERIEGRDAKRKELGIGTPFVVLMAATVYKNKDYDSFLNAARLVLSRRSDVTFLAAGHGSLLEHYRSLITEQERSNIRFLGGRSDVESLIHLSDIGVLCSFKEGISNTILEYMAQQKPVIATGGGGTSEIIENGKNGYLLPASNPEQVAKKILYLLDRPEERETLGKAGYETVLKWFDVEKSIIAYNVEYRKLINNVAR